MALIAERAVEVRARRTEWLWRGWIPLGALSLLGGPPGTAKSMLTVWLAAKVTRGELAGDLEGKARSVLIVSSEDDLATTIKPRFVAAGGNVSRLHFVDPANAGFELPGGLDDMRAFIVENEIRFVVLDPVAARISGGLSANNDKDVRRALEPVVGMLHDLRVAAVGVTHMRKATTIDSVSAMMGSMAFSGLARSVVATYEDDEGGFLFSSAKMNLGPKPDTLRYEVVSADIAEDEEIIETARVRWMGATDRTVDEALIEKAARLAGRPPVKRKTAIGNAAEFLMVQLGGGPRLQRDVAAGAQAAGYSVATLTRAKSKAGIISRKTAEGWTWELRHPYDLSEEMDDLPD